MLYNILFYLFLSKNQGNFVLINNVLDDLKKSVKFMKTIEQKFEQAKKLTEMLVSKSNMQSDRYYFVLRIFQDLRLQINDANKQVTYNKKSYFNRPELTVTSSTYIRAKKALEKQIHDRFKNR